MLEILVVSVSFGRRQIEQVLKKPSASFQQQIQRIGTGCCFGAWLPFSGLRSAGVEPQRVDGLKVEGRWVVSLDEQLSQLQQSEGRFNT